MNGRCCEADPKSPGCDEGAALRPPRQACIGLAGWVVPGTILAIMPKCPACLATYMAVGTGLALSTTVAASLRMALIALSVAWLSYLGVRRIRSAVAGALSPLGRYRPTALRTAVTTGQTTFRVPPPCRQAWKPY